MFQKYIYRFVLVAFVTFLPQKILAATTLPSSIFSYGSGTPTFGTMILNITGVLAATITPVASAIFALGAFLYLSAAEKEERKNQGKEFMFGGLIGIGVVAGAKGILNLVMFFIYS